MLTLRRVTLIGDAAHLMAPFAGVGVNAAMEDALMLSRQIAETRRGQWHSKTDMHSTLTTAVRDYERAMWGRAETYAHATWKYLNLFFHADGAKALIDHFREGRK